ncbi:uncharacterized protein [Coffea arabica]|uniref:Uncharacterized protein isoform X2 n=1 Tax=Coffea arabica TaxID=13443 RepID=A0A6P6TG80_COFAR|nr:RAB11-binding protein RELCH homolog isoform X2 [Coffea arabica]
MDVEKSSLCNCVVNFLLEENYLLTAFELLHELLDDGRDDHAIRLKEFFSDPSRFPPDQISRLNSLRVADPQSLLDEKEALEEKLALSQYELRLAQEDVLKLKTELENRSKGTLGERSETNLDASADVQRQRNDASFLDLGSLKDNERQDLNCAVKEYLLFAGYRLTAMTFYEEVTDQNLDVWQNSSACVPDALRHYYYQYLSSSTEAAQEKITMLRENESLQKENDKLKKEKQSLLKSKDIADTQVVALMKSLEAFQKDIKDKEVLVQEMKQSMESQRKELNDCRAEITALKMHIARSGQNLVSSDSKHVELRSSESYMEEIKLLENEIERLKGTNAMNIEPTEAIEQSKGGDAEGEVRDSVKANRLESPGHISREDLRSEDSNSQSVPTVDATTNILDKVSEGKHLSLSDDNGVFVNNEKFLKGVHETPIETNELILRTENIPVDAETTGLATIQVLSDALPKIVPYVLINHREELLPLMMCAIERHPDSMTRDSLTHTLFNLIKRPDEQQRRIIMDACVTLAKNVGEMRTETELLPQCWEQINHMYEERRLLVAQSCGELAEFVRPEIRDSLILSIVQQLIEDPAIVVREAAAHNLALLLPLFPNMDKYFKVEEMMFQLVCDPSGVVVETTIKELVPALVKWGNKLDHVLQTLLSHILGSVQHCPPLSGVEGSVESHLRVLGERERWNIDVLLRLLTELLPFLHQTAVQTCPFASVSNGVGTFFSVSLLELYSRGNVEWPSFDWLHIDCFPDLIQLASLLPQKEDNLRNRITKLLLRVSEFYGEAYLTHIVLPVFLLAVGDDGDLTYFPQNTHDKIIGLRPKTTVSGRLATMGVLPLLLAGVLGSWSKHDYLTEYLRKKMFQSSEDEIRPAKPELVNSVRFLCMYEDNHNMIFDILWEMVVNSNIDTKICAANLLKSIVPYLDAKIASTHVLPALVTLGSDQNLNVKYASIDAFGAVAQHYKNDMIIDKIRVQMDAFLEDGSHEATIAVVRALVVAVPHTTDRLRDYLLSKIFQFTAVPLPSNDLIRRRERANAFCEAIRALDATDLPASSVRDFLLPGIQNLLKDTDALDPAHKEALEIIMKERSGGTLDTISKVMGAHLGLPSSVSSFFGESGLLGKRETVDQALPSPEPVPSPPAVEDTRLRRIMRGSFTDMLRGKAKGSDDTPHSQ